jgi:hypothetical protein
MGRPLNKRFFDPTPPSNGESVVSYSINVAGTYTAIPTVTVSPPGLPDGVTATLGSTAMKAVSAVVTVGGTGDVSADYAPGNTLTVAGGTGTAPVFSVTDVKVRTAANVTNAGGFLNGNTVTFSTGWATPAVLTLTVNGGGVITGVAVTNAGVRSTYILPTDPVTPNATNGPGTLAGTTFNLGFSVHAISLATAGSLTALPANPVATTTNSVTGGTGATLTVTYGVLSVPVATGGSGYVSAADAALTFNPTGATATAILSTTGTNVILAHARVYGSSSVLDADIVKQTSTNEYLMNTIDGSSICTLVESDDLLQGQAYIKATDSLGSTYFVVKLTAHLAVLGAQWDNAGSGWVYIPGDEVPWNFDISGDTQGLQVQIESA